MITQKEKSSSKSKITRKTQKPKTVKANPGLKPIIKRTPDKIVRKKELTTVTALERKAILKMPEPQTSAIQKTKTNNAAYTLDEVQIFILQHNARKTITLPGRTAKDIEIIHEAFNKSTFKYANNILEILKKWANN
jgi:hypothetical protein